MTSRTLIHRITKYISYRALDNIMGLKQDNIDGATGMKTFVASAPPIEAQIEEHNLPLYRPEHVLLHAYVRV